MKQLPILQIVRHSLSLPFESPKPFLKAMGILFGIVIAGVVLLALSGGGALLEQVMVTADGGQPSSMAEGSGLAALLFLVLLLMVLMAFSHIFNVGVRAGASGPEGADFPSFGDAAKAAGVNSLKFFFIAILLVIVSLVVVAVLNLLGLAPELAEQLAAANQDDLSAVTKAGLMNNMIVTLVSCVIYSLFSANLTQTAMGSEVEGLSHPHTVDFAIVLVLLYAVLLIPVTLAGLMGSAVLMHTLNIVLGVITALAIGVAHGVRYRICMAEKQNP